MKENELFELGFITKTHGLKGDVVAEIDADHPQHYKKIKSAFLKKNNQLVPYFVEKIQITHNQAIIKFEDIKSDKEAQLLKGSAIMLPLDTLPKLADGHFYFHEIKGFEVIDQTLGSIGTVIDVYELPNNDLLAFDYEGNEVLMPLHDDFIVKVDKSKKEFHVNAPDGLLEIYTKPQNKDDGFEEDLE